MKDNYYIETTKTTIHFFVMLLISAIASIIPMLVNNSPAIQYTAFPFYMTIIILFGCIIYYRWLGLLVGLMTFLIYDLVLGFSIKCELPVLEIIKVLTINTISNILQLLLILLAFSFIKKQHKKNKNKYAKGVFYLSKYNSILIFLPFVYLVICLAFWKELNMMIILSVFSIVIFVSTVLKIFVEKDIHLFYFTVLIAFFPSVVACLVSIVCISIPRKIIFSYFVTWVLSNYILLQTFGYLLFQLLYRKKAHIGKEDSIEQVDVSSICYYFAVLIWNIIVICLYYSKQLGSHNNLVYLFPWMLGNMFLCANLIFSVYNDAGTVIDKFKWFEQRVIVVEKNTAGIITIISFLLPLGVNFLRNDIPDIILFLFIVNIFAACFSVGIIWVPASNVKFIALLKTLKTIFYLYSIMFLLVSVIMIMQLLQNTKASTIPDAKVKSTSVCKFFPV